MRYAMLWAGFALLVALVLAAFARSDDTVKVFDGRGFKQVPFDEYLDSLVPRKAAVVWTWQTGSDYGGVALYRDKDLAGWLIRGHYYAWDNGWTEGAIPADAPPPPKVAAIPVSVGVACRT